MDKHGHLLLVNEIGKPLSPESPPGETRLKNTPDSSYSRLHLHVNGTTVSSNLDMLTGFAMGHGLTTNP
jgi:hypothetical protein